MNRRDSVRRRRDAGRCHEHGGTVRRAVRRIPQDRFAGRDEEDGKAMVAVCITRPLASCRHREGRVAMDEAVIPAFDAGGMNVLGTDDLQRQNRRKRGEQHDGAACAGHVYGSSISRAGIQTYDSGHIGVLSSRSARAGTGCAYVDENSALPRRIKIRGCLKLKFPPWSRNSRRRRVEHGGRPMLFSERSVWTMAHGIVLGGAALMGLAAALFTLLAARSSPSPAGRGAHESAAFAVLNVVTSAALWLTVILGTYIVFPPYRATPPAGLTELSQFPRSLVLASPDTAWLHAFAMETKEHAPWIAAMLSTAVAFISARHRSRLSTDPSLRKVTAALVAITFVLVAYASLLGIFVNKVAPLQ